MFWIVLGLSGQAMAGQSCPDMGFNDPITEEDFPLILREDQDTPSCPCKAGKRSITV